MTDADAAAPPHLLLGSCDYPEHVPQDRWTRYAEQQRSAGLHFVRIAEFAWSRLEPEPGRYDWAWLDHAIEAYHGAGLKVVLCTLTATPPAWLIRAHPEVLPYDEQGRVREFGSRRHYDFASPVYREHSRRVTLAMALRYGRHPAVVGWQTDNEFGCHATSRSYGGASAAAFPEWLRQRYTVVERLNEAWGNVFWSMEYVSFDQIRPPILTVTELNPSHVLDYARHCSSLIADFQREQVEILREMSPGRFITHNFMIFESGFDHYEVARGLDFASWDNYPLGMLEHFAPPGAGDDVKTRYARTGHPDLIALNHDIYRSLASGGAGLGREGRGTPPGMWVMEQQCGQVNWAPYNPLPADGAVALWTAQAWAHGADVVSYFRWRAATMAQEVMHSGLLRHDETEDRGLAEVRALDQSQFPAGDVPARVALLHDYESLWLYDQQPHAAGMTYWAQVVAYYGALRSLGVDVDIVHADADVSAYAVVVAPAITLMSPERAERWTRAVQGGVKLVSGPRTAFRMPGGQTWAAGQPGPLSDLLGVKLLQFDSLRPTLTQDVSGPGGAFQAQTWAESYRLEGAQATYTYAGGPLDGHAAVAAHGNATVIGAHSPDLLRAVLSDVLAGAGVEVTHLPEGVRISRRAGRTLVQNWTTERVTWQDHTLEPVSFEVLAHA
ncbi:beta-galactosidase [Deinococcus metalli]|uniref:Beta-galactosidase n=1 Tax=Deinococcus metalli TaxID=1141878 RepID=A0A7W8KHD8_9DEIO|nr:beta-galactosidase [Deinococcus metalli]MBB5377041.1 beta-galactosidase [Deinococcus metalli]GHF49370.1 beta-galactosidase [Deinococcus metalli]